MRTYYICICVYRWYLLVHFKYFPPASAVEGIKSVTSVRLSGYCVRHTDPIYFVDASDSISEVQRSRLKVKVVKVENMVFRLFHGMASVDFADPFCPDV